MQDKCKTVKSQETIKTKLTTKCGSLPAQSARLTDISDPETLSGMAPGPLNIKFNHRTKEIKCEVPLLCMSLHKTWSKAADKQPTGALRAKRGKCSRFEFQVWYVVTILLYKQELRTGALVQRGFEILPLDLSNKNLEIKFYEVREGESSTPPDTVHTCLCGIRYSGHYEQTQVTLIAIQSSRR